MQVIKEYNDFQELYDNSWSGARDVLDEMYDKGLEDEVMEVLEMVYEGCTPTDVQLNDFIWFELENSMFEMGYIKNEDEEDDGNGNN